MSRRTTVSALVLVLLVLAAPPAAAKGPTQVEVHNLRTGETTKLTDFGGEQQALMELLGWPDGKGELPGTRRDNLEHIATLSWQYDEQTRAWVDRVYYAEDTGATWVERHMSGSRSVSWARVPAGRALETVLAAIEEPAEGTTAPPKAPAAAPSREPERRAAPAPSSARLDGSSFGWGAGTAMLLAASVALARRWRQRSVTASRNSRVSMPASS
jgi:hypothetical protein